MKVNRISFLFFIAISFLSSCNPGNKEDYQNQNVVNYIDPLFEEADSLKNERLYEKALQSNHRAIKLAKTKNDTLYAKGLRQRIVLLGRQKTYDSIFHYTDYLLEILTKLSDSSKIADAYYLKGFYFKRALQLDSTIVNYYRSVELYKQIKDSVIVANRAEALATALNAVGNYQEGEEVAVDGLRYTKEKDSVIRIKLFNELAILTKNRGDYNEALYWYEKAGESTNQRLDLISIINNRSVVYLKEKQYKEAFDLLSSIKDDSILNDAKYNVLKARVIDNWAFAKGKLKHPDAEKYLLQALELRKVLDYPAQLNASYIHLAEYYADRNDARAFNMAQKAFETAKASQSIDDELNALAILIETAKAPKEYALEYKRLNDSVNKARARAKSSYAKIKYDVENNRKENQLLKANTQLQASEINRVKARNVSLLLLLIVLVGGGIWRYVSIKNKHKREKELAAYETERMISKRVHDEVANDVYNTLTLVQNEAKTIPDLDKFETALDRLYRKTRNISRDYGDIDTGANYSAELKDMLATYHSKDVNVMIQSLDTIAWPQLNEVKKRALYRCLQELMVNMKKHSKASLVVIAFKKENNKLVIRYSDNGVGFNIEEVSNKGGLQNVENRIEAVNGSITFGISSNLGSSITINIPL